MTDKQKTTLLLFAQNYSLQIISKKQEVSLATIRERIKSLSKHYPREFNNSVGLRGAFRRAKMGIKYPKHFTDNPLDFQDVIKEKL